MTEGTVTNDSHAREDTHLAGTFGHGDGSTHAHGGVDGTHVEAQGVATDVAEHLASFMLGHDFIQGIVAVDVRATL